MYIYICMYTYIYYNKNQTGNNFKFSNQLIRTMFPYNIILIAMQQNSMPTSHNKCLNQCNDLCSSRSCIDKTEEDSQKNFIAEKSKPYPSNCNSNLSSQKQISLEKEYDILNQLFERLDKIHLNIQSEFNNINLQLLQFPTAQLLSKSDKSLWNTRKTEQICQNYCKTVVSLQTKNIQLTHLEMYKSNFMAVQGKMTKNKLLTFEADTTALKYFERRKQFLDKLKQKCKKIQKNNSLSEISQQILFLYREYHKQKQSITKMLRNKSIEYEKLGEEQTAMQRLKYLKKQLKQIRTNKVSKTKAKRK